MSEERFSYDAAEKDLVEKAMKAISSMSKHGKWQMCVPPQKDDSDLTLARLCDGYLFLQKQLSQKDEMIKILEEALWYYKNDGGRDIEDIEVVVKQLSGHLLAVEISGKRARQTLAKLAEMRKEQV